MKHNPGFLAADELIASFVARRAELESLLEVVRNNTREANQHVLVIGRRGMGKTMLVHRLELAVKQDLELGRRWYPLMLREESHTIGSAGELWLEALQQLALQTGEPRWREAHATLRRELDERRLHDLALARLLDFAEEHGKRLLITLENLQDILGEQMSKDDAWTLRHTLLNEPRIMLVATATNRFDDIDNPKAANYEMFRVIQLLPLDAEECRVIWQQLTGERLTGQRVRPIQIFTGGNPRLLTILGSFARQRTLRELMSDLLGLIDDHTDYFKSNLEALPLPERRVFLALCELWEPSPARAVAEVTRFDINKASMCLTRLVSRGAVEIVRTRGRAQYYQVTERLYNLFHWLRRSSTRENRATSIVEFMMRFYGDRDLEDLAMKFAEEACRVEFEVREDHLRVLHRFIERASLTRTSLVSRFPQEFWRIPEVKRSDLPWRPDWDQRYRTHLVRTLFSAWPGPFTSLDEADTPLLNALTRWLGNTISAKAFKAEIDSQLDSRHPTLIFVCKVLLAAKSGDEDLERELLQSAEDPYRGHLRLAAFARVGEGDLPFQAFAERHLLAAIECDDLDVASAASRSLAGHYVKMGQHESAIAVHERMLARHPTPDAYCEIGRLATWNDPRRAEAAYRAATALSPHNRRANYALLELLFRTDQIKEFDQLARRWRVDHPDDALVASVCLAVQTTQNPSDRGAEEFVSAMEMLDPSSMFIDDLSIQLTFTILCLAPSVALRVGRILMEHASTLSEFDSWPWFDELARRFAASEDRALVQLAAECDDRSSLFPKVRHVKYALFRDGPERALDVLSEVASKAPDSLRQLLDVFRSVLMQLALANPSRLYEIVKPIQLLEPLTVALAQELGEDVLAPYEVMEIAKDIRAELRELRGPTYEVDVPILAAAEDSPRPRRSKKPPARRKSAPPKKPTSRKR